MTIQIVILKLFGNLKSLYALKLRDVVTNNRSNPRSYHALTNTAYNLTLSLSGGAARQVVGTKGIFRYSKCMLFCQTQTTCTTAPPITTYDYMPVYSYS
jgi:hypothetical protein